LRAVRRSVLGRELDVLIKPIDAIIDDTQKLNPS